MIIGVYEYIYICMYIYLYVYIFMYIYISNYNTLQPDQGYRKATDQTEIVGVRLCLLDEKPGNVFHEASPMYPR